MFKGNYRKKKVQQENYINVNLRAEVFIKIVRLWQVNVSHEGKSKV